MAKIVITPEQLAAITTSDTCHVRFRLISEDRNRYSAWTPIFSFENANYVPPPSP